ncbi:MAG: hypothetical protein WCI51_00995 [Lentisphaerota bacterium]
MKEECLVKGGCGRSEVEVISDAKNVLFCAALALIGIVATMF